MKRLSVMILSMFFLIGPVIAPSHADLGAIDQNVTVRTWRLNGTIESIDLVGRIVSVQSDGKQGEVRLLVFSDAEVVKGLRKGDRVVIGIDKHGIATKAKKIG